MKIARDEDDRPCDDAGVIAEKEAAERSDDGGEERKTCKSEFFCIADRKRKDVSPVAWAMDGFTALTYNSAHLADILVPLAVLLGMTIVLFLIAIPRFRYQVD